MRMSDYPEILVLDHGFVRLIDHMGDDQRIVDAARVSYQKGTKKVSTDKGLIRYLLRNLHTTPFEKVRFEFHVKLPIFVARQWMRHRTGSFNEVSGRYSKLPQEFYVPEPLRKQSKTNRQGSSSEIVSTIYLADGEDDPGHFIRSSFNNSYADYQHLLEAGAARELARGVLPLNIYTEFYWTVDLWNLMHFLRLRLDAHAQLETRLYAEAIFTLLNKHCDLELSLGAFQDYILDRPDISKFEMNIIKETLKELQASSITSMSLDEILKEKIQDNLEMSDREKRESKLLALLAE